MKRHIILIQLFFSILYNLVRKLFRRITYSPPPINTLFPQNPNPYFRIRSPGIPLASSTASYLCRLICSRASFTVSESSASFSVSCTLNSIIIASGAESPDAKPPCFGSNITSYRPKPLSRFDVNTYLSASSTIIPNTKPW